MFIAFRPSDCYRWPAPQFVGISWFILGSFIFFIVNLRLLLESLMVTRRHQKIEIPVLRQPVNQLFSEKMLYLRKDSMPKGDMKNCWAERMRCSGKKTRCLP